MKVDHVLAFAKAAIRVNLSKFAYKNEKILLVALDMIEKYQTEQKENGCAGCKHYGGMAPDCMAPSLTPCPKEQSNNQGD